MTRIAAVVLAAVMLLAPVPALAAEEPAEDLVTEVFQLRYIDINDASVMLRTVVGLRRISLNKERQELVVRDTAEKVGMTRKLLGRIDVPPPSWSCEVIAIGPSARTVLRSLEIQKGDLQMHFGSHIAGSDSFWLNLRADEMRKHRLAFTYQLGAQATAKRGPALHFSESTQAVADGAKEMTLLTARLGEQQESLAAVVGVPHPVEELRLVLTPR
jgi:hypothetical protein